MSTKEVPTVAAPRGRPPKLETPPTDVVKEVRAALGMTQEEAARELNCSLNAVRVMERERRLPGSGALLAAFGKLAKRAGVEVAA